MSVKVRRWHVSVTLDPVGLLAVAYAAFIIAAVTGELTLWRCLAVFAALELSSLSATYRGGPRWLKRDDGGTNQ